MDWTAGLLGGLAAGGGALSQLGMMQIQRQQKKEDQAQEEKIYEQRQRFVENLKAPAEKTVMSNDDKGHAVKITQQWVPPPDDQTPGHYQEVGREIVPTKYTKDTITTGSGVKQNVLYNENDPTDVHNLGAPDDTEAQRTAIERQKAGYAGAELGLSGQRLGLESRRVDIEAQRAANEKKAGNRPGTYDFGDDLQGVGVIDPETNTFKPAMLPSGQPMIAKRNKQNVALDENGNPAHLSLDDYSQLGPTGRPYQQQGTPSMYAGVDPDYAQQQVGVRTPMSQLSGSAINAGGSGAQQTPRPAQASTAATGPGGAGPTPQASAQGRGTPKLQVNKTTGQKRYVYPDGTIVPVGQ